MRPARLRGCLTVIILTVLMGVVSNVVVLAYPAGYRLPFEGSVTITSGPTSNESPYHSNHSAEAMDFWTGTEFAVYAVATGRAYFLADGKADGFGNVILIQHNDGNTSFYAHLSKAVVGGGQTVEQGAYIGNAGSTGTTSIHLHFEIRSNVVFDGQHFPYSSGDPVRIVDHPNIDYKPNPTCCNRGTATGEPIGTAPVESTVCLVIDVDVANLRSGPGTSYSIAGAARRGESFPIASRAGNGNDRWYEIGMSDGRAWVWSGIVRLCPYNGNIDEAIPELNIPGPVPGLWLSIGLKTYQRCPDNISRVGHVYQSWGYAYSLVTTLDRNSNGDLSMRPHPSRQLLVYENIEPNVYEIRRENEFGSVSISTLRFRSPGRAERFRSTTGCATILQGNLYLLIPRG